MDSMFQAQHFIRGSPLIQSTDKWPLFRSRYRAERAAFFMNSDSSNLGQWHIQFRIVMTDERPEIPAPVRPSAS
jgi:hypothetical protein